MPARPVHVLAVVLTGCAASDMTPPEPEPDLATGGLVINEVAAAGSPADWFEVVNSSADPIDLSALVFVDQRDAFLRARRFPDVTLGAGDRHVQAVVRDEAGFALGKSDELWIYVFEDRLLIDSVTWRAGASPRGGSYARIPDATGAFVTVTSPTSGAANQ